LNIFALRFLAREGCHLCDQARPLVGSVARRLGIPIEEIDVDEHDDLLVSYGLRIPVVLAPDDRVLAEGVIDNRRALHRAIRQAWSR
jgi:hypothetical protein